MATKVIATYNSKGGIGKTTLTINLAEMLGIEFGKKVLCIDGDPQNSLSFLANLPIMQDGILENDDGYYTLGYLEQCIQIDGRQPDYEDFLKTIIRPEYEKTIKVENQFDRDTKTLKFHFDLIPGIGRDLSLCELIYINPQPGDYISNGDNIQYAKMILQLIIERIKEYFDYDYILIDTPPGLGIHSLNALLAADSLIIPTTPDLLSTIGINNVIKTLDELQLYVPDFKVRGVLFNSYADSKHDSDLYDNVKSYMDSNGITMFTTKVNKNSSLRLLSDEQEIAVTKNSKTYAEFNKNIYQLAKEIIEQDEE